MGSSPLPTLSTVYSLHTNIIIITENKRYRLLHRSRICIESSFGSELPIHLEFRINRANLTDLREIKCLFWLCCLFGFEFVGLLPSLINF